MKLEFYLTQKKIHQKAFSLLGVIVAIVVSALGFIALFELSQLQNAHEFAFEEKRREQNDKLQISSWVVRGADPFQDSGGWKLNDTDGQYSWDAQVHLWEGSSLDRVLTEVAFSENTFFHGAGYLPKEDGNLHFDDPAKYLAPINPSLALGVLSGDGWVFADHTQTGTLLHPIHFFSNESIVFRLISEGMEGDASAQASLSPDFSWPIPIGGLGPSAEGDRSASHQLFPGTIYARAMASASDSESLISTGILVIQIHPPSQPEGSLSFVSPQQIFVDGLGTLPLIGRMIGVTQLSWTTSQSEEARVGFANSPTASPHTYHTDYPSFSQNLNFPTGRPQSFEGALIPLFGLFELLFGVVNGQYWVVLEARNAIGQWVEVDRQPIALRERPHVSFSVGGEATPHAPGVYILRPNEKASIDFQAQYLRRVVAVVHNPANPQDWMTSQFIVRDFDLWEDGFGLQLNGLGLIDYGEWLNVTNGDIAVSILAGAYHPMPSIPVLQSWGFMDRNPNAPAWIQVGQFILRMVPNPGTGGGGVDWYPVLEFSGPAVINTPRIVSWLDFQSGGMGQVTVRANENFNVTARVGGTSGHLGLWGHAPGVISRNFTFPGDASSVTMQRGGEMGEVFSFQINNRTVSAGLSVLVADELFNPTATWMWMDFLHAMHEAIVVNEDTPTGSSGFPSQFREASEVQLRTFYRAGYLTALNQLENQLHQASHIAGARRAEAQATIQEARHQVQSRHHKHHIGGQYDIVVGRARLTGGGGHWGVSPHYFSSHDWHLVVQP